MARGITGEEHAARLIGKDRREERTVAALGRELRNALGNAVQKARKTAEAGARAALGALMVEEAEADASLTGSDRDLRRRLRAHGRQLGDRRTGKKQEVTRLAREVAYEHWHRMLFARFLAENGLLIEPEMGVAVSLDDCRELARGQKKDPWALAGEFAAAMLPQIFRADDPSLAVSLPPETRRSLEKTLAGLPPSVFHADDALGWTYQYWQTDRKNEVNASEAKIGADELPAVTQLFTEPYMVRFLFHNTVGAWRAGRLLAERPELAENAASEDELRQAVRLEAAGGYDFDFLRFVREEAEDGNGVPGPWCPAAGSFDGWPTRALGLRVLDPCCGSGHFLVEGLHVLVRLRMEEDEKLSVSVEKAIRAVLSENLHGLEIDPRCAQIAAFSVAFAAWRLAGRVFDLPPLRIACSGLAPNTTKDEWIVLADRAARAAGSAPEKGLFHKRDTLISADLRNTFEALHSLFAEAPTVGSLLDPHRAGASMYAASFDAARPLLDSVLSAGEPDPERRERVVAAAGMAEAASILAETYSLVITNVPYLARRRHDLRLNTFGQSHFKVTKGNLATMFIERAFGWTGTGGAEAFVSPHSWLFQRTAETLRSELLRGRQWLLTAWLGPGAFETVSGYNVCALTVISGTAPTQGSRMAALDVSTTRGSATSMTQEKATALRHITVYRGNQAHHLDNPDSAVMHRPFGGKTLLNGWADGHQGIATGDYNSFGRNFWELPSVETNWAFQQATVKDTTDFGGREHVLHWEKGDGVLQRREGVRVQGGGGME